MKFKNVAPKSFVIDNWTIEKMTEDDEKPKYYIGRPQPVDIRMKARFYVKGLKRLARRSESIEGYNSLVRSNSQSTIIAIGSGENVL